MSDRAATGTSVVLHYVMLRYANKITLPKPGNRKKKKPDATHSEMAFNQQNLSADKITLQACYRKLQFPRLFTRKL
jgi:hypothetical protein